MKNVNRIIITLIFQLIIALMFWKSNGLMETSNFLFVLIGILGKLLSVIVAVYVLVVAWNSIDLRRLMFEIPMFVFASIIAVVAFALVIFGETIGGFLGGLMVVAGVVILLPLIKAVLCDFWFALKEFSL